MSNPTVSSTRALGFASARLRRATPAAGRLASITAWLVTSTWLMTSAGLAQSSAPPPAAPPASKTTASPNANLPNAVLFSTAGPRATVGPLDSVIHGALERLGVVKVSGRPGMDLNAVQLAIDCVSETPQCLRAVAKQTGAEVLIAPSLQSTPAEMVLSVLRFDSTDARMRRVVRRQPGTSLKPETLDGVPNMLRELFGLPEPAPVTPPPAATARPESDAPSELPPIVEPPQEPEHRPMPVGPWVLAGAGALVIGGGAVMGAMFLSTQSEYDDLNVGSEADVDDALELRDKAETQAVVANILYGVGGAMVVAGGIWLAVALSKPSRRADYATAVIPTLGPNQFGLTFVHRGGAL